jgi:hypothetical protein
MGQVAVRMRSGVSMKAEGQSGVAEGLRLEAGTAAARRGGDGDGDGAEGGFVWNGVGRPAGLRGLAGVFEEGRGVM